MKKNKITLLALSLMCAATAFGQLKVDSNGRTIFGDDRTYTNGISITDAGTSATNVAFRINRGSDDNVYLLRNAIQSMAFAPNGAVTIGQSIMYPFPALNTTYSLEVHANISGGINLRDITASASGYRAVVYSTTTYPFVVSRSFGQSLFTQTFYVKGDGSVWSASFGSLSDVSLKSNIEKIENPLDKVLALQGVSYDFNFVKPSEEEEIMSLEEAFAREQAATPGITMETFKQIQEEKKRKHIGVIAQDVEKVLPEVVRTREDGLKAVMYSDITGLLIEAIKEQQIQIEQLRKEIDALTGTDQSFYAPAAPSNILDTDNELIKQCVLHQNIPNPFNARTEIRYELPSQVKQAEIYIFNMQGTLLKRINADRTGYVTINGNELTPGLYLYSLVADGVAIDTKRMILTD